MCDFAGPTSDMRLPNSLEGVHPLRVLLPDLHHLPEAAFANHFEQVKCFDCERFIAKLLEIDFEVK